MTDALAIGAVSAFAAAQSALKYRPAGDRLTFLYTGNFLNTRRRIPTLLTLGIGKAAAAHLLDTIAPLYADRDARFYYVDERTADGDGMFKGVTGDAPADYFLHLTTVEPEAPVLQTFVAGRGYVEFEKEVKVGA
jgi:hypothetical protein